MITFMRNLVVVAVAIAVAVGVVVPVTLLANAVGAVAGETWQWVTFLGCLVIAGAVIATAFEV